MSEEKKPLDSEEVVEKTEVTDKVEKAEKTDKVKKADKNDKVKKDEKPKQSKVKKWVKELKAEINKIVWPEKTQVKHNTVVVLVTVCIAMLIIAGLDFVFQFISDALIALG